MTIRNLAKACAITLSFSAGYAATQVPYNWGNSHSPYDTPEDARTRALCRQLGPPVLPAADRPTPSEIVKLKDCDSEALYYGIGSPPDFVAARKCAIIENDANEFAADSITGAPLLTEIYANGLDVPKNRDLATRLACVFDGESVRFLQTMGPDRPFDWCNVGSSGMKQGLCAQHQAHIDDFNRATRLTKTTLLLPASTKALLTALVKASETFSSEQANGETDATGTARVAEWTFAAGRQDDQFVAELERIALKKWPSATPQDADVADQALNREYRRALTWAASKDNFTTIKPADIRTSQRAWLPYRDAWVRFGVSAQISPSAIITRITRLRIEQLQKLE